ncbi:MAG: thioredoxin domain-containing protein [Phycisphaerae bacterium]|nr:thioredoxin domain-containing protein [Phycisphaerae bacterium]
MTTTVENSPIRRRRILPHLLRWSAVVVALVGWWLSLVSLQVSMGAKTDNPLIQALCDDEPETNSAFDCNSVLKSDRAWAGRSDTAKGRTTGVPWASLGMAYFGSIALWYAFVGLPTRSRHWWHLMLVVLVAYSVSESIGLIRVMAFELHQWCGICLATHAVNGVLLIITLIGWPWHPDPPETRPYPTVPHALAGLMACGFASLTFMLIGQLANTTVYGQRIESAYKKIIDDRAYMRWRFENEPVHAIPLAADEALSGDPKAPHTLVVFTDFRCPACRLANAKIDEVLKRYPGTLRVAHHFYPQDGECNPRYADGGGHRLSCKADRAALAALDIGGPVAFARMRELIFERQHDIELDRFTDWAAELGLAGDAFAAALDSPEIAERIAADIAMADGLEVKAVPALFLDGRRLEHWRNDSLWQELLEGPTE